MTYCVAVMLDAGMVFASDSRTNAGLEQMRKYPTRNGMTPDSGRCGLPYGSCV